MEGIVVEQRLWIDVFGLVVHEQNFTTLDDNKTTFVQKVTCLNLGK